MLRRLLLLHRADSLCFYVVFVARQLQVLLNAHAFRLNHHYFPLFPALFICIRPGLQFFKAVEQLALVKLQSLILQPLEDHVPLILRVPFPLLEVAKQLFADHRNHHIRNESLRRPFVMLLLPGDEFAESLQVPINFIVDC